MIFGSEAGDHWELWVMNADGNGARRLVDRVVAKGTRGWSPDGSRIVFDSERDGNREIYTIRADGSGLTRLTNDAAEDRNPAWSPDGTRIAFTSTRDGNFEIYQMRGDGTATTRLTNDPARVTSWRSPRATRKTTSLSGRQTECASRSRPCAATTSTSR